MADLGNLYFDVLLRDKTASEAAKIKKDILDALKADIDVNFDKAKLEADVRKAVQSVSGAISVSITSVDDTQLKALTSKVYDIKLNALLDDIADALQKAIEKKSYKIPISAKDLQTDIQSALKSGGFTVTATPNLLVSTIQAQINNSHGGKPYTVKLTADASDLANSVANAINGLGVKIVQVQAKANDLVKSIKDALTGAQPFKIDVVVDKATARQVVQQALSQVSTWNGKYTADDLRAAKAQAAQQVASAKAAEHHAKAQLALSKAHRSATSSSGAHMRASMRLSAAMGSQISIAGQLKDQFLSLYSLYTIQSFLRNVVKIGGELEKQQLAMSAILHNESQSAEIGGKLKSLAVRSPFGVLDLNRFAKQLTAYTIPYNELYDTMKRLADISAGVGVDMGRIVLAFGQIRAAKFLKGTELRQLTEANIPMVDALADRFSKLEGRIISAGEVMEMISKKKVTFEDVKAVLWEMTGEGGAFYNMQETLAESVAAKWKNLGDAIDIMYSEIAASKSGLLKGLATTLTLLVQNWEMLKPVLYSVGGAFVAVKIQTAILNGLLTKEVVATEKSIMSSKKKEAQNLKLAATYRDLDFRERAAIKSSDKLRAADLRELIASGQITKEQTLRLVALRKLSIQQAMFLRNVAGITDQEILQAASTNKLTLAFHKLALSLKNFAQASKSFLMSPGTFITAGMFALMELYSYFSEKNEETKRMVENLTQKGEEGFKHLYEVAAKFPISLKLDDAELQQAISEMETTLKDYHPNYGAIFNKVFGTEEALEAAEKYSILSEEVRALADAYKLLAHNSEWAKNAGNDTDGIFDESLKDNVEDYAKSISKVNKEASRLGKHMTSITKALNAAANADSEFAKAIADKKSLKDKLLELWQYRDAYSAFYAALRNSDWNALSDFINFLDRVNISNAVWSEDIMPDVEQFAENVKSSIIAAGWDKDKLTEEQQNFVRMLVMGYLDAAENVPDEIKKKVMNAVLLKLNIKPQVEIEDESLKDRLTGWKKEINDLTDGEYEAKIKVAADVNDVIEVIQKAYKDAKAKADELEPIFIKLGIKSDEGIFIDSMKRNDDGTFDAIINGEMVRGLTQAQLQAIQDYEKVFAAISRAKKASEKIGFSLEKSKDPKGSNADNELTALKHRYDTLKKAYQMFKELKETMGEDGAVNAMNGQDAYKELFSNPNFDINDFENNARKLAESLQLTTDARKDFIQTIKEDIFKAAREKEKSEMQEALKDIEDYISKASQMWSLYKDIFSATGDKELASQAFADNMMWNQASKSLFDKFAAMANGRNAGFSPYTIDWSMTQNQAKEFFGQNQDLLKLYQEIQKMIRENGKEYLKACASAIKGIAPIGDRIKALENQRQSMIDDYKLNFGEIEFSDGFNAQLTEIDNQINKLKADFFELSPIYEQIFGSMTYKSYGELAKAESIASELIKNATAGPIGSSGKPDYYKSFYMDGSEQKDVQMTRQQLERLKKVIDEFFKTETEKNPFRSLMDSLSKLKSTLSDPDASPEDKAKAWAKFGESFAESAQLISGWCSELSSMFDALGSESLAGIADYVGEAMNSMSSIAQGFATGGVFGGVVSIASVAVGWIGKLAQAHDRKLDKAIEKSKLKAKQLQNIYDAIERALEHTLGSGATVKFEQAESDIARLEKIQGRIAAITTAANGERTMQWQSYFELLSLQQESLKLEARKTAYQEGGAYGYQRQLMKEQLAELEKQRQDELDKKKTNDDAIADYDDQIAEMTQQIKDFAEEMADTLYGINLKDWASQLGDALYEAWQKGEDGAEAFKKKVADIMGDVMNSILKLAVLEPAMQELQKMLFGEDGMSGYFGQDFELQDWELANIADYLMKISTKTDDYYDALDKLNKYMEDRYGVSLKEKEGSSSGLSVGIQSVTEDTADLLASYLNAIRADVSVKREYARRLVEELFPGLNAVAQAQLQQLEMIQINTARNADFASDIYDLIRQNTSPGKGFKIA